MPERDKEQEPMERGRGTRRDGQQGSESGSRIGKTHQPQRDGMLDDEADEFEGYDQRWR